MNDIARPSPLRIDKVSVRGLFGLYDHTIQLNLDERVTIIHGPNGVGKTKLLSWIQALFSLDFSAFAAVPFDTFEVEFTDKTSIEVRPGESQTSHQAQQVLPIEERNHTEQQRNRKSPDITSFLVIGRDPDGREHEHRITSPTLRSIKMLSVVPWLTRRGPDSWWDEREEEVISTRHALDLYSRGVHLETREFLWLREISDRVNVYFVQTERLLRPRRHPERDRRRRDRELDLVPTVRNYSDDLLQRIQQELSEYARVSQSLDQTFPQQLLVYAPPVDVDIEDLKQRMTDLGKRRVRFAKLGLLSDDESSHPFDVGALDALESEKMTVLAVYVENTEAKLSTMGGLADRIEIFLGNVNQKFSNKKLSIDPSKGMVVTNSGGSPVDLGDLSSGEQHELVLLYDLLFNVQPHTLVLIDEPELSLHITWQKRFLNDLLIIAKTADLDALIATHSPFIIGEHEDLMVSLATVPADRADRLVS